MSAPPSPPTRKRSLASSMSALLARLSLHEPQGRRRLRRRRVGEEHTAASYWLAGSPARSPVRVGRNTASAKKWYPSTAVPSTTPYSPSPPLSGPPPQPRTPRAPPRRRPARTETDEGALLSSNFGAVTQAHMSERGSAPTTTINEHTRARASLWPRRTIWGRTKTFVCPDSGPILAEKWAFHERLAYSRSFRLAFTPLLASHAGYASRARTCERRFSSPHCSRLPAWLTSD